MNIFELAFLFPDLQFPIYPPPCPSVILLEPSLSGNLGSYTQFQSVEGEELPPCHQPTQFKSILTQSTSNQSFKTAPLSSTSNANHKSGLSLVLLSNQLRIRGSNNTSNSGCQLSRLLLIILTNWL